MVREYMDRFGDIKVCVLVNYQGLSADEVTQVRTELTEQDLRMFVLKNSIAERVFEEAGNEGLTRFLDQPAAIIYGRDEPVRLAKTVTELQEENENMKILGGMVDRTPLDPETVKRLSDFPTRHELLSQLAAGMMGPVRSFAQGLVSPIQDLARGLEDYASEDGENQEGGDE